VSPEYALGKMAPLYLLNNDLGKNYETALDELEFSLANVLLEENDFSVGIGPSFAQTQSP
jgi:hypothetical protein